MMTERPSPLTFWGFDTKRLISTRPVPWIAPELQAGTTPLVKLMGGKATRDFTNYRHPAITADDYLGARSIIRGDHKLVIHNRPGGNVKIELFDLAKDPAETENLIERHPELVQTLGEELRRWQASVLQSLAGADYAD